MKSHERGILTIISYNDIPRTQLTFFFVGIDRHHFMGQIFQNMGHLSSRYSNCQPGFPIGWDSAGFFFFELKIGILNIGLIL